MTINKRKNPQRGRAGGVVEWTGRDLPSMCKGWAQLPTLHKQELQCTRVIPTLERQRQDNQEFKVFFGYIASSRPARAEDPISKEQFFSKN